MNIPYRHRRTLKRALTVLSVLFVIFSVTWLCWVIWLQRYVIYTDDGAQLNFSLSSYELTGKEAIKPQAQQNVSIFYNEGADAIDTTNEMTQLNGYYITSASSRRLRAARKTTTSPSPTKATAPAASP